MHHNGTIQQFMLKKRLLLNGQYEDYGACGEGYKTFDILTPKAFENALTVDGIRMFDKFNFTFLLLLMNMWR